MANWQVREFALHGFSIHFCNNELLALASIQKKHVVKPSDDSDAGAFERSRDLKTAIEVSQSDCHGLGVPKPSLIHSGCQMRRAT